MSDNTSNYPDLLDVHFWGNRSTRFKTTSLLQTCSLMTISLHQLTTPYHRAPPTRFTRYCKLAATLLCSGSGELGLITNSAWSIFWRTRITCLEDSAHPSEELGLPPSELGPQFYYKVTYQYMNLLYIFRRLVKSELSLGLK